MSNALEVVGCKYSVHVTSDFKKDYKKILKQGKDKRKLREVVIKLANKEKLDLRYNNHKLNDNKYFKDCYDIHIEPDWVLIYKYIDNELILLLIDTGSHSEVLNM
ncbi:MAG: type II toxin-antitoxin system YafQ family toxin [Bacilli bacterium]|nr:type II toxin-antitoxin system YafQ family toxin [Bacilli bacterium]